VTDTPAHDLASYAARPLASGNRALDEPESADRGPFRRDRDRIVHAQAFRRLAHKTQVFMSEEGDHYRTRLTHTIEVAQIARSLARNLGLDTDLTEALALAHDLGHTPFGHTGEDALAYVMQPFGGFEHNAQTLRIVTHLEQRYASFDGLNLTFETLAGIVKHNGPMTDEQGQILDPKLGGVLPFALTDFMERHRLDAQTLALNEHGSLEAQIATISDDIAYNTHDIDDGVRAGFFALDDLRHVAIVDDILSEIETAHPQIAAERRMGEFTRRLITRLIHDVDRNTRARLKAAGVETAGDVKKAGQMLALFSDTVAEDVWMIKAFLFKTVYRNAEMMALRSQADQVLRDMFAHLLHHPDQLPEDWRRDLDDKPTATAHARTVCDFIAGMTDRYALSMHARLFDDTPDLRYGASI
jgi:dGTPase